MSLPTGLYDSLLTQSCSIWRNLGSVRDANGQLIEDWHEWEVLVPCWLQPFSAKERMRQAGDITAAEYRLFLKKGSDIQEADRVRVDGSEYQVTGIIDAGGIDHHLEVELRRTRPGGG